MVMNDMGVRILRFLQDMWAHTVGRPHSIRERVFAFLAIVLTPLSVLALWLAFNYAGTTRQLVERELFDSTRNISSAVDQDVALPLGMLIGLAADEGIRNGNFEAFEREAKKLIAHPSIQRLWIIGSDGVELASSGPTARDGDVAAVTDAAFRTRVFAGRPAISRVFGSGPDTRAAIAVPVGEPGAVIFGLGADVSVVPISRLFNELDLAPGWVAAVVDKDGNFVARSIALDRLGRPARPELKQAAQSVDTEGAFDNTTHEGLEAANRYQRSEVTGWTTVVAAPRAALSAPVRNTLVGVLVAGAAILAATVALASILARTISEPVRSLSAFATTVASGRRVDPLDTVHTIAELEEVRAVLERELAQSARLAAIVASSGDAIMSMDLDGTIMTWNGGAEELFGYRADEIVGKSKRVLVPPDMMAEFESHRVRVLQGETIRSETIRLKRDGTRVDVSLDTAPIRRGDGTIIGISSIIHDISERKAAEAHKVLLMRELAHRSKNQLAIIQSIAGQTARTARCPQEFVESFRRRLQGLAASHDLLSSQDFRSVPLVELAQRHIEIFTGGQDRRVSIDGPEIRVRPAMAEGLGLALHELSTNSIKYGALSAANGRVELLWQVRSNGGEVPELHLQWSESGGPEVSAPAVRGFGSQVIETLVARSLNGRSVLTYDPAGVRWTLDCPLGP